MKDSTITLLKAIRAKCLDCCGGAAAEADNCPARSCPLHPYRSGRTAALLQKPESRHEQLLLIGAGESKNEE